MSFLSRCLLLSSLALPVAAAAQPEPAPTLRFFAVPWVEGGATWHAGRSNPYFTFRRGNAGRHFGAGLAVEVMPSPNVAIGFGLGVMTLGGAYLATYQVTEFFSKTTARYTVARDLDLTYLRAPLYVRVTPHLAGPLRGYALAGIEPALRLSVRAAGSDIDATGHAYANDYGALDGALLGGAGLEWWFGPNTAVFAGLRYRHGFIGIQDERPPYPGGDHPGTLPLRSYQAPFDVNYPLRNRSLTLEVGVKFGPTRRPVTSPDAAPLRRQRGPAPIRTL